MKNSVGSDSTIRTDFSSSGAVYWGTLTLQNTWLRKTGGSKRLQKRPQTQLVHLLVSSPINTWRHPEREEALTSLSDWFYREHLHQSGGGLTVKRVTQRATPSPSSLSSCSPEMVLAIRLRMKRVGRMMPRAPHRNECRRTLLLYATSALHENKWNLDLISGERQKPLICSEPPCCFSFAARCLRLCLALVKWASE